MQSKYTHIFEPLTIKHMTLKNRIVMTPINTEILLPSLSDNGPANGSEIKRPNPNAAAIAVTFIASFIPH